MQQAAEECRTLGEGCVITAASALYAAVADLLDRVQSRMLCNMQVFVCERVWSPPSGKPEAHLEAAFVEGPKCILCTEGCAQRVCIGQWLSYKRGFGRCTGQQMVLSGVSVRVPFCKVVLHVCS